MVAAALSGAPKDELAQTLNKLDREGEAYMKHAEKKCQLAQVRPDSLLSGSLIMDSPVPSLPFSFAVA
jgi:hypothetical protein